MSSQDKQSNIIVKLAYIYVLLPILLFFVGWCNTLVCVLGITVILISAYFLFKDAPKLWVPKNKKEIFLLAFVFLLALIWVYSSGIGGLVYQNPDHYSRNAIFDMMVNSSWPIFDEAKRYIMVYYFAFWLVPASVGKVLGLQAGYYFQVIWATLGVFMFFYLVLAALRKKTIWPILLFIFFSGLDILGCLSVLRLGLIVNPTSHIEWWASPYQFSSMTTQLFWVFNQALPCWLIVMLMYHQKNNKHLIFLYSCMLLHSSLPAIGMLPFLLYFIIRNGSEDSSLILTKNHLKESFKSVMTFTNVFGGGVIGMVTYLFLSNNISGGKFGVSFPFDSPEKFILLSVFLFFEVGIYILCIRKYQSKNPLFYISILMFLICPFVFVGPGYDFTMRASIPALLFLFLLIVQTIDAGEIKADKKVFTILLIALLIGSITPIHEFNRTVKRTLMGEANQRVDLRLDVFFGYVQDNLFVKYLGKK